MRIAVAILLMASAAFAQDQAEAFRMSAGCGATTVQFNVRRDANQHPVAQPQPGKAIVHVFRDEIQDNGAFEVHSTTTRVGVDGTWVGANSTKSYFSFAVDPGDHRLCTERQSEYNEAAAISFSAESGDTYYFRTVTPERPIQGESVELVPIDPAEAQLLIPQFAHSTFSLKKTKPAKKGFF